MNKSPAVEVEPPPHTRARWLSKRALLSHLGVLVWVPGCGVAAWWQVTVALGGNDLAYLYSVEWPVFAVFGVVAWWNLVHDDPNSVGARGLRRLSVAKKPPLQREIVPHPEDDEPIDDELAAYNAYLAELSTRDEPKTWKKR